MMETPMGTALHERMLAYDYGDQERKDLMREVWSGHPWMVDSYTGSYDTGRKRDVLHWLYETFGPEALPIHGRPGRWYHGSATINGWTWMGFQTEEDMNAFIERWPTPEGIEHPE